MFKVSPLISLVGSGVPVPEVNSIRLLPMYKLTSLDSIAVKAGAWKPLLFLTDFSVVILTIVHLCRSPKSWLVLTCIFLSFEISQN